MESLLYQWRTSITKLDLGTNYYKKKQLSMIFMFFYLFYLLQALGRISSKQKQIISYFKKKHYFNVHANN